MCLNSDVCLILIRLCKSLTCSILKYLNICEKSILYHSLGTCCTCLATRVLWKRFSCWDKRNTALHFFSSFVLIARRENARNDEWSRLLCSTKFKVLFVSIRLSIFIVYLSCFMGDANKRQSKLKVYTTVFIKSYAIFESARFKIFSDCF